MSIATDSAVGHVLMRGGKAAQEMSKAPSSGEEGFHPLDVWKHSYEGMQQRMSDAKNDPASIIRNDPAQAARVQAAQMPGNWSHSSVSQMTNSVSAQAGALGGELAKIGEAKGALATIGATFGFLTSVEQMLSSVLSVIPFPALPAVRIADFDIGLPHAHNHPPNLIPPAPPIPLPSTGPVIPIPILSGANTVLINGMPAARCGDMGLGIWCGGYFPFYEIFLGSSSVWIEGMRAARLAIDITKHCTFTTPKPNDPPLGPMIGFTITASSNVIIGGLPMPSLTAIAIGAAIKGLFKLAGKLAKMLGIDLKKIRGLFSKGKENNPKCNRPGEPIDPVSGSSENEFIDYGDLPQKGFRWERFYRSAWNQQNGPLGFGFRHSYQYELIITAACALYTNPEGNQYAFPRNEQGIYNGTSSHYQLVDHGGKTFVLSDGRKVFIFERTSLTSVRLSQIQQNDVRQSFIYNEQGLLDEIEQTDAYDHLTASIHFHYDAHQRIIRIVRTSFNTSSLESFDVHSESNHTEVARYSYNTLGCLETWIDPHNATGHYEYDDQRRMTKVTDRNGYSFIYQYDFNGRCIWSAGEDKLWRVKLRYEQGCTTVTEADLAEWRYYYDETGTITKVIDPYGGETKRLTDAEGNIVEEIDSGGRVMHWLYDERGQHTNRQDHWGNIWPTADEAPNLPNPLEHKIPETLQALQYGDVATLNFTQHFGHPHELDQLAQQVFNEPTKVSVLPIDVYDKAGRVIEKIDADGQKEQYQYDASGNVIQYQDKDCKAYHYQTTSWNLKGKETDPLGHTITYSYTYREKISLLIDANHNESSYTYDYKDRITSVKRHGKLRENYTYDQGDRLIEKRDGEGNVLLSFEIGQHGLHSKRILASGQTHHYDYDAKGNFTKASTDDYEVTLSHDWRGRRLSDKRDDQGITHTYQVNHIASTTYFDRFIVQYETNLDGEVVIQTPTNTIQRLQRSEDNKVLLKLSNQSNELKQFNREGLCTGRMHWQNQQLQYTRWTKYQYSATGELQHIIDNVEGRKDYFYDDAHRLLQESAKGWPRYHYEYDPAGNLLKTPQHPRMDYWEGNRLSLVSGREVRYNARNHIAGYASFTGDMFDYQCDSMDMLVQVIENDKTILQAEYDGLCRRISKTTKQGRTEYYWDDDRLVAEISPDRQLKLYVYLNEAAYQPFMFIEYDSIQAEPEQGKAYYVFHNQVGLPEWIEDELANKVWEAEAIEPYGYIHIKASNRITYNLRFPGHYYDEETKLNYNRFRYYDPRLGRYLQSDPMGQAGGINLYAYTANPLTQVDVLGLTHKAEGASAHGEGNQKAGHSKENPQSIDARAAEGGNLPPHVKKNPDRYYYDPEAGKYKVKPEPRPDFSKGRGGRDIPCFEKGTLISTPNGLIAIENIKEGDLVTSFDTQTSSVVNSHVIKLVRNKTINWIVLEIENIIITTTLKHRFWEPKLCTWIEAKYLQEGMGVLVEDNQQLKISNVKFIETEERDTYNLTIENFHTYFVSELKCLVHNEGEDINGKVYIGYDEKGNPIYVGQTRQTIDDRQTQHIAEGKAEPDKYGWKEDMKIKQVPGMDGLTEDEMDYHERRIHDQLEGQGHELKNRQIPLTDEKVNALVEKYC